MLPLDAVLPERVRRSSRSMLSAPLLGGSDGVAKGGRARWLFITVAVAVVLLGMALYFSLAEIGRTFVAHLDEDGDGDVSWAEVEAFGRCLLGRPVEP